MLDRLMQAALKAGGQEVRLVPGRRIVHTEAYEGHDWEPLIVTTKLDAVGPDTLLTVVVEYASQEICDRDVPNLQSASQGYDDLAALLAESEG